MDLVYKTLFEIKLLHEFFLIDESGKSIFEETNASNRDTFLMNTYMNDHESINRDVSFDFPEEFKERYAGYYLKIIPSYSGCKVFIRVNKVTMPDNSIKYQPFIPLPDDLNIFIVISKNNHLIDMYTNSRMTRSLQSLYFFSNDDVPDVKTFPFILNNISIAKSGYTYEQGELALDGSNDLIEYYYDNSGALSESFINSKIKSFSNENDRMLLPLKFDYTFINNNPMQATFELKDKSGNTVKSIDVNQSQPILKTIFDFSGKEDADKLNMTGVFSFHVNAGNGFSETSNIFFADSFYSTSNWGVINIKTKVSNTDFDLISNDGFLNSANNAVNADGDMPAVFLLPVKSRYSNYRYSNDTGLSLKVGTGLQAYLSIVQNSDPTLLISNIPVPLSKYFFMLPDKVQNAANNATINHKYFPNPVSYMMKKDVMKRICLDVVVPESDLFPVV